MKKFRLAKSLKRCAAVLTAAVFVAVLAPFVHAAYKDGYVDSVGNIGADLSGNGDVAIGLNNLFIYMMNQSLPVGSIYVTQSISSVGGMVDQFGGTWEVWGEGRAPAGVNSAPGVHTDVLGGSGGNAAIPLYSAVYPASAPDQKGGAMNDTTLSSANIVPIPPASSILSVTGGLTLTRGKLERITPGSFSYDTYSGATVTRPSNLDNPGQQGNTSSFTITGNTGIYQIWGSQTISNGGLICNWPNHTHHLSYSAGFAGGNSRRNGDGSTFSALVGTTGNTNAAVPTDSVGGASPFSVDTPFNLAWWSPTYTAPNISYTAPKLDDSLLACYTPQYFKESASEPQEQDKLYLPAEDNLTLTLDTDPATATWTNETIQPYVTVYMYKRTGLAVLDPLA